MGVNTNVDEINRNANVDNTTRQGNTYDGADPPVLLREGPEDQTEDLIKRETPEEGPFDPADHRIRDVKAWVRAHPDQVDAVLTAEENGKNRITLILWLVGFSEGDGEE
jgi:hypothetical protein